MQKMHSAWTLEAVASPRSQRQGAEKPKSFACVCRKGKLVVHPSVIRIHHHSACLSQIVHTHFRNFGPSSCVVVSVLHSQFIPNQPGDYGEKRVEPESSVVRQPQWSKFFRESRTWRCSGLKLEENIYAVSWCGSNIFAVVPPGSFLTHVIGLSSVFLACTTTGFV